MGQVKEFLEIREWLERLYSRSPGYFGITGFQNGKPIKTKWYQTSELDAARRYIDSKSEIDLYLSVGTHSSPQKTRGGESTVISIPGFWTDLDIGEIGHKPASLPNPPTEQEALSIVNGLPEASMLMHSGGGLQAFWIFEEGPWVFEDAEDKAKAKKAIQEWANLLEEKGKELGFHVDKVADLARILRVPGTFNYKADPKRPVQILWSDKPGHDVEELTAFGIPDSYDVDPKPHDDNFPLTWNEILAPHGYTQCNERTWTRPGKNCDEGISLSIAPGQSFVITNFSESDDILPVGRGTKLTKLRLYAILNHDGDIAKAKKVLSKRRIKLTQASSIVMKPIHWLWENRIALGTLALLAGREGIGKSTLAYRLAADITKGMLPGIYEGVPRNVIIIATEDSWEFTIVPRLVAADADLDRVFRADPTDEDEYGISLPRDIEELSSIIKTNDIALILLDPLMSRVDSKLDSHKDQEVRQALEPLVKMGDKSGASVLGLIHVNKSGSTDPLSTLMGSRAFSAVARAVLYVVEDPDDRDIKIMGQPKNNLGRSDLPDLSYSLNQVTVGNWGDEIITSVTLNWGKDQPSGTHREMVVPTKAKSKSKVEEAAEWLVDFIESHNGKASFKNITETGEKFGFYPRLLQRAREEKTSILINKKDFQGQTFWYLPEEEITHPWEIGNE